MFVHFAQFTFLFRCTQFVGRWPHIADDCLSAGRASTTAAADIAADTDAADTLILTRSLLNSAALTGADVLSLLHQGALTHGDRRATESRDLSRFNIDNKYGRAALEATMKTVMGYEQPIVPPPDDYKGNFFLGEPPPGVLTRGVEGRVRAAGPFARSVAEGAVSWGEGDVGTAMFGGRWCSGYEQMEAGKVV